MLGDLAAQLQRHLLQVAGRGLNDQLADFGGAGEGDLSTSGCAASAAPAVSPIAGDDVDDAVGNAGFLDSSPSRSARQRRLLGRLEHDGAARGQSRAELPGRHQQREVPGDDLTDHADRLAQGVGVELAPGVGHGCGIVLPSILVAQPAM